MATVNKTDNFIRIVDVKWVPLMPDMYEIKFRTSVVDPNKGRLPLRVEYAITATREGLKKLRDEIDEELAFTIATEFPPQKSQHD